MLGLFREEREGKIWKGEAEGYCKQGWAVKLGFLAPGAEASGRLVRTLNACADTYVHTSWWVTRLQAGHGQREDRASNVAEGQLRNVKELPPSIPASQVCLGLKHAGQPF